MRLDDDLGLRSSASPVASTSSTNTSASIFSSSDSSARVRLRETTSPTRIGSPFHLRLKVKHPVVRRPELEGAQTLVRPARSASAALLASRPGHGHALLAFTDLLLHRRLQRAPPRPWTPGGVPSIWLSIISSREKMVAVLPREGAREGQARAGPATVRCRSCAAAAGLHALLLLPGAGAARSRSGVGQGPCAARDRRSAPRDRLSCTTLPSAASQVMRGRQRTSEGTTTGVVRDGRR